MCGIWEQMWAVRRLRARVYKVVWDECTCGSKKSTRLRAGHLAHGREGLAHE